MYPPDVADQCQVLSPGYGSGSCLVMLCVFLMLPTIQFHGKFQVVIVEIKNKFLTTCFYRMLPAKFCVCQTPVAQQTPHQLLGIGLLQP